MTPAVIAAKPDGVKSPKLASTSPVEGSVIKSAVPFEKFPLAQISTSLVSTEKVVVIVPTVDEPARRVESTPGDVEIKTLLLYNSPSNMTNVAASDTLVVVKPLPST